MRYDTKHYLSVPAVARRLGVHESTVRRWIRAGIVPAVRTPGGHYRIYLADVELAFGPVAPRSASGEVPR